MSPSTHNPALRTNGPTRLLTTARGLGAAAVVVVAGLAPAAFGGAILEGWQAFSAVESNDPNFGRSTTYDNTGGFGGQPISRSLHVARGGGVSDTQILFDAAGAHTSWTHSMALGHEDAEPRSAYIYEFNADYDSTYSLSGFYSAIGHTRMSAIIDFWSRDTGQRLFRQQIDTTDLDPSLTIGVDAARPGYHDMFGSLTGTLAAGGRYRLDVDCFLRGNNAEVSADAGVDLRIVGVPGPGSAVLGAVGLFAMRRRRTYAACDA